MKHTLFSLYLVSFIETGSSCHEAVKTTLPEEKQSLLKLTAALTHVISAPCTVPIECALIKIGRGYHPISAHYM